MEETERPAPSGPTGATGPVGPSGASGASAAKSVSHTGLSAETMAVLPLSNSTREDLSTDALLTAAPRLTFGGSEVPALGGIALLSKLGQGGMGAVYFGVHPRLRMEVAVKVLPFHLASQQPQMVQRFFREGQIAARVKSPHLVGVIDVNEEKGLFYLVMEYIDGISAGGLIRKIRKENADSRGLPETTALDLCIAATQGLICAHDNSIIHRDIKPDNILIPKDKNGEPQVTHAKLADLGLARIDDGDSSLTGAQSTMGTPGFMAPEQANDAKSAGKPADVFSMGATLYALLSGLPPFQETTSLATILAAIQKPHIPLTKYRADITLATQEIIDRSLAKDPGVRYADASELLVALQNARDALASPALPSKVVRGPARTSPALEPTLIGSAAGGPKDGLQDGTKPPSSSLITNVNVPPPASPPKRKSGVLTLVGVLAGIPLLIALGWFGFNALNGKPAEPATPQTPAQIPVTPNPDDENALADKKAKEEKDRKDAEDAAKKRQAELEASMKRTAEQEATHKMLQEKALADAQAATAAVKKASDDQEKLRAALDAEKTARVERDRLSASATTAKDAADEARTQFDKRNEDVQMKETDLRNARGHGLAGMAAAEKAVMAAKESMREAGNALRRRDTEREKLRLDWQTASQNYNSKHDDRLKAEALAAASKDEVQAAQKTAADSVEKLRAFDGGTDSKPQSATTPPPVNPEQGPYKLYDGPYKVDTLSGQVHDAKRNKDLPLKVYYPLLGAADANTTFPVIVFSHGWLASRDNYEVLGRYWASHGYIVMHPTHDDSLALGKKDLKDLLENFDPYADPKALENRFQDIVLTLDSFGWLESKVPALKNHINSKQIGVGGHSLGAYTSQVIGGATVRFSREEGRESFEDKRADAILLLSPQGRGEGGLFDSSWNRFKKPMLLVTGTQDRGLKKQNAGWRKDPYDLCLPGDKYQLVMDGAKHGLGGISGAASTSQPKWLDTILGAEVPEQRDWVRMSSLAFWDAYLKNDATAKSWLGSSALKDLGAGKLTFEKR